MNERLGKTVGRNFAEASSYGKNRQNSMKRYGRVCVNAHQDKTVIRGPPHFIRAYRARDINITKIEMVVINKDKNLMLMLLCLPLSACLHTGPYTGPYTANSPSVLVQPTHRAWLKEGSTREDENAARGEC